MSANKEMQELNPEMMEPVSGGLGRFTPLFPGLPGDPLFFPEHRKDEPKDGGATGGW